MYPIGRLPIAFLLSTMGLNILIISAQRFLRVEIDDVSSLLLFVMTLLLGVLVTWFLNGIFGDRYAEVPDMFGFDGYLERRLGSLAYWILMSSLFVVLFGIYLLLN
jgi:hypothetical protein